MIIARQSTARTVMVGPILDADGVAVTDGVVADFEISKNGGVPAALNGSATLTHRNTGHYSLALTASDLDTVGQAEIVIDDTVNACPIKVLTVVEEAVYDALFAASAVGPLLANSDGSGLTAINLPNQTMDIVGNITGNLSGSVGSVTGAVGSVTGAVGSVTGAVGSVTGDIGGIAPNGLTLDALATDTRNALGLNLSGTLSGTHSDTTADLGTGAPTEDVSGQTLFFPVHQLSRTITSYNTGTGVATFDSIGVTLANGNVWHLTSTAPSTGGGGGGDATEAKQDAIIALIGTPAGASLAADIAVIEGQTDDIGAAGAGLTALATAAELAKVPKSDGTATWNATALASLQQEATDALNAYDPPTKAEVDAAIAAGDDATLAAIAAVDAKIDTIDNLLDTEIGSLTTELAKVPKSDSNVTWNATALASIQSEANDALVAYDPPTAAELTSAVANVSVDEIQASALADLFNTDSGTTYASAVAGSVVKEVADNAGGSGLTAAAIADAVWDETLAGHVGAGSTGEALNAAGGAGDPWITSLPGAYTGTQAGAIIGQLGFTGGNVNANIESVDGDVIS